jgi:4-diphosphocytidyl-2-C-methyl-D-erythritol kinase
MVRGPGDVVHVRVPAKLNLHLSVGPRRSDGFHELVTVYLAVDLYDELMAAPGAGLALSVDGEGREVLAADETNLVWRAASALADHAGVAADAQLVVRKAIPVGGGLAGGSADAAAALVGCAELWGTGTDRAELSTLAAEIGSDVPFALAGGCAVGTGRGEQLAPALTGGAFHFVLALSEEAVATPDAYRTLDRIRSDSPPLDAHAPDAVLDALRRHDPHDLARHMRNDLEAAALALVPRLRRTLAAGRELGALAALVSGSGATCLFLVDGPAAATSLAAALAAEGVCRTTRVVTGPVPGARVTH